MPGCRGEYFNTLWIFIFSSTPMDLVLYATAVVNSRYLLRNTASKHFTVPSPSQSQFFHPAGSITIRWERGGKQKIPHPLGNLLPVRIYGLSAAGRASPTTCMGVVTPRYHIFNKAYDV
jgi:hypothetical protein